MIQPESIYYKQVQLLIRTLPLIFKESCFALKGGTAINLFIRDIPRLSVDIDLVYLPFKGRTEALEQIHQALSRITEYLEKAIAGIQVHKAFEDKVDALRLIVGLNNVQIKVELSPVLRGTVFEPEFRAVSESVEDRFGYAEVPVVAMEDLYGGKICAALDRQHPRDLFDIRLLLDNEGLTETIRKTALVYIISHSKPISELLDPRFKDISSLYDSEFSGMTVQPVTLEQLEQTRSELVRKLRSEMTLEERKFLVSFKKGTPDWSLMGLNNIDQLPAVQWKQLNLSRMPGGKHNRALEKLIHVIEFMNT
jgi:predicted nucleotidyltransferase component of viral defense system